jgi:hypothetical protein
MVPKFATFLGSGRVLESVNNVFGGILVPDYPHVAFYLQLVTLRVNFFFYYPQVAFYALLAILRVHFFFYYPLVAFFALLVIFNGSALLTIVLSTTSRLATR